jgi:hypothetical protein
MKTKIFLITLVLIFMAYFAKPIHAHETHIISQESARLVGSELNSNGNTASQSHNELIKEVAIKRVLLRYNSPLTDSAGTFTMVARALNLDPYLLPSISGVESCFGKRYIPGTYNPFGWNVGRTPFDSWDEGIAIVGHGLKHRYIDRGATTVASIGPRYAGGSTTWAGKVLNFMAEFENEEARIRQDVSFH